MSFRLAALTAVLLAGLAAPALALPGQAVSTMEAYFEKHFSLSPLVYMEPFDWDEPSYSTSSKDHDAKPYWLAFFIYEEDGDIWGEEIRAHTNTLKIDFTRKSVPGFSAIREVYGFGTIVADFAQSTPLFAYRTKDGKSWGAVYQGKNYVYEANNSKVKESRFYVYAKNSAKSTVESAKEAWGDDAVKDYANF